jgi:hypothetical protein
MSERGRVLLLRTRGFRQPLLLFMDLLFFIGSRLSSTTCVLLRRETGHVELIGRQRVPDQITLCIVAALLGKKTETLVGFDPFGYDSEIKLTGHRGHRIDNRGVPTCIGQPGHEAPVDLDSVDGQQPKQRKI